MIAHFLEFWELFSLFAKSCLTLIRELLKFHPVSGIQEIDTTSGNTIKFKLNRE